MALLGIAGLIRNDIEKHAEQVKSSPWHSRACKIIFASLFVIYVLTAIRESGMYTGPLVPILVAVMIVVVVGMMTGVFRGTVERGRLEHDISSAVCSAVPSTARDTIDLEHHQDAQIAHHPDPHQHPHSDEQWGHHS